MNTAIRQQVHRTLGADGRRAATPTRLVDDAQRLYRRFERFRQMLDDTNLAQADDEAVELACHALQLPRQQPEGSPLGAPTSLRNRVEAAAELLMTVWGRHIPADLLDRTHRLLLDMPQKTPETVDARLLAEALDFEDFGLLGVVNAAMQMGGGKGVAHLVASYRRRDEYGYWQARLKDDAVDEALRDLKKARLAQARKFITALAKELEEDEPRT